MFILEGDDGLESGSKSRHFSIFRVDYLLVVGCGSIVYLGYVCAYPLRAQEQGIIATCFFHQHGELCTLSWPKCSRADSTCSLTKTAFVTFLQAMCWWPCTLWHFHLPWADEILPHGISRDTSCYPGTCKLNPAHHQPICEQLRLVSILIQ